MNTQFKKGILDLCVLSILNEADCYGYDIVNKILEYMKISEGSIYPLLRRLKKDNLVTSYLKESIEGPPRKYYKLTVEGISAYHNLLNEWDSFQNSINQLIKSDRKEV
ncbi:MAG: PadR family transcriptional regulator [Clostridiales bacterium]|nr:PadR family transcriptional regulator [Clostridiales bacterium]